VPGQDADSIGGQMVSARDRSRSRYPRSV